MTTIACLICGTRYTVAGELAPCQQCGAALFVDVTSCDQPTLLRPPTRRPSVDDAPDPPAWFTRVGELMPRPLKDATDEELLVLLEGYQRLVELRRG